MTVGDGLPVAVRATAKSRSSLIPRRRRFLAYDARFADGRIARNVDVDAILQGHRLPADSWATRAAAERACPEVGQGDWVEFATGRRVSGLRRSLSCTSAHAAERDCGRQSPVMGQVEPATTGVSHTRDMVTERRRHILTLLFESSPSQFIVLTGAIGVGGLGACVNYATHHDENHWFWKAAAALLFGLLGLAYAGTWLVLKHKEATLPRGRDGGGRHS